MSKYAPLGVYLQRQPADEVAMSFADIEHVTGTALPPRAQAQRAWWSNNASNNVMTKVWLAAGFRTERVDLGGRRLVFRRSTLKAGPQPWQEGQPIPLVNGRHPLIGAMKGMIALHPEVDLTEPADPDWADIAANTTLP